MLHRFILTNTSIIWQINWKLPRKHMIMYTYIIRFHKVMILSHFDSCNSLNLTTYCIVKEKSVKVPCKRGKLNSYEKETKWLLVFAALLQETVRRAVVIFDGHVAFENCRSKLELVWYEITRYAFYTFCSRKLKSTFIILLQSRRSYDSTYSYLNMIINVK